MQLVSRGRAQCAVTIVVILEVMSRIVVRMPMRERRAGGRKPRQGGDRHRDDTRDK